MDAISVVITESAGVATMISVLGFSFRRVFKMGVAQAKAEARVAELEAHVRRLQSELDEIRLRPQAKAEARVAELEALVRKLQRELDQIRGRRRRL